MEARKVHYGQSIGVRTELYKVVMSVNTYETNAYEETIVIGYLP